MKRLIARLLTGIQGRALVIGRAFGDRTCVYRNENEWFTQAHFQIDRVLAGNITDQVIELYEPWYPIETENESYLLHKNTSGMVRNGQPMLLMVAYMRQGDYAGMYTNLYFPLPLPADYEDYSEESLTALLDYYRNKPGAATNVKNGVESTVENGENVYYYYGSPKKELNYSNEKMLELMDEHILVQLSVQYQIKIWPMNHVNYEGLPVPIGISGIKATWRPPSA